MKQMTRELFEMQMHLLGNYKHETEEKLAMLHVDGLWIASIDTDDFRKTGYFILRMGNDFKCPNYDVALAKILKKLGELHE